MSFQVIYTETARRSLNKMDAKTSGTIISWIEKNLIGTDDPRKKGKPLTGEYHGIWRYRVGDYRVFAKVEDNQLIILVLDVRNRRTAYR